MLSSEEDFDVAYRTLRNTFSSNITKEIAWREWQLKQVWWMITDYESQIIKALKKDLNRHAWETYASDLFGLKRDILHTLSHFKKWIQDEKLGGDMVNYLGGATVRKEPLGVSLIIGAWNFPIVLLLQPMIAAIVSGCAVLLKPSELAVHSQNLLMEILPKYLDPLAIRIISAGPAEMGRILDRKFDQIFYTGSPNVAKIVAKAAAKFLTPTVLELGGQGPAIVTRSADLNLAAKRIAAAKFLNAGQICLSTNHAFVPKDLQGHFVERLKFWFEQYSTGAEEPWDGFCRIVEYGGSRNRSVKFIHPTVLTRITMEDSTMSQELFAPVLPFIEAETDDAIKYINSLQHPLAIYVFSTDKREIQHILDNTNSGGVTVNDCMIHAGLQGAPFGGVGEAGQGYYHGEYGIRVFSHLRTVVNLPTWMDRFMSFRYPPYSLSNLRKLGLPTNPPFQRCKTLEEEKAKSAQQATKWLWCNGLAFGAVISVIGFIAAGRHPLAKFPSISIQW